MGWETRKRGGRYYTRSRKVGGRVIREYIGAGLGAEATAQLDSFERAERQLQAAAWRKERTRLDAIERDLAAYCTAVGALAREHLTAAGYHQHARGEWRRKRMAAKTPAKTNDQDAMTALIKRSQEGDQQAMDSLRSKLRELDRWEETYTGPAQASRDKLLEVTLGRNLLVREAWARRAKTLQRELAGPAPTPLERLLCERIATCWLDVQLADMLFASKSGEGMTFAAGDYYQRRQDRAQRRYLDATLALARVRRLLAPVVAQVNIAQPGAQQLNIASPAQPASATPVAAPAAPVAVVTSPTWPPAERRAERG
jgi:hypothetical protein